MFDGIFNLITEIIRQFVFGVLLVFDEVFFLVIGDNDFLYDNWNISLFSDNIIFTSTPAIILTFITITILLVIIIKFLIKSTYKIIKKVFGVIKL